MPLVDITASAAYYPPEDGSEPRTHPQALTIILANCLPNACVAWAKELWHTDIPANAAQVNIHRFHRRAVNSFDLRLRVQFTEPFMDAPRPEVVTHVLSDWFDNWQKTLICPTTRRPRSQSTSSSAQASVWSSIARSTTPQPGSPFWAPARPQFLLSRRRCLGGALFVFGI
jgi:hypothetical protein